MGIYAMRWRALLLETTAVNSLLASGTGAAGVFYFAAHVGRPLSEHHLAEPSGHMDHLRIIACLLLAGALMVVRSSLVQSSSAAGKTIPGVSQRPVDSPADGDAPPAAVPAWTDKALMNANLVVLLAFIALLSVACTGNGNELTSELLAVLGGFAAAIVGATDFAAGRPQARNFFRNMVVALPGFVHLVAVAVVSQVGGGLFTRPAVAHHLLLALSYVAVAHSAARMVHFHQKSWGASSAILQQLKEEEKHNDEVLSLLLPPAVMSSIKESQDSLCFAEEHDDVAVLFVELANFASIVSAMPPAKAMELLNSVFYEFDFLTTESGLLKVETVGSVYMVASGIPDGGADSCAKLGVLALKMRERIRGFNGPSGRPLEALMGIHAGPVIGGVIGYKLPRFRLFGDTVNTAARMETHSLPGEIGLSEAAANRISRSVAAEVASWSLAGPADDGPGKAAGELPPPAAPCFQHLLLVDRGRKEVKSKGLVRLYYLREEWVAGAGGAYRQGDVPAAGGPPLDFIAENEGRSSVSSRGGSAEKFSSSLNGAGAGAAVTSVLPAGSGVAMPAAVSASNWHMRFDHLLAVERPESPRAAVGGSSASLSLRRSIASRGLHVSVGQDSGGGDSLLQGQAKASSGFESGASLGRTLWTTLGIGGSHSELTTSARRAPRRQRRSIEEGRPRGHCVACRLTV